jgi:cation transport regulator ChaC
MSRRRNPTLPASLHPALRAADGAPYFSDDALEEANTEGETYKSRTALVLMDPADFLRMADPGKEEARQVALEQVLREGTRLSDVPRLFVDYDETSGVAVVTGHEGRHRSRSLLARGVKQMPVRIHTTNIRWSEQTSPKAWDYIEALPHTLTGEDGHAHNRMPMPVPIHYPQLAERMMKKNPAARAARTARAPRAPKTYLFSYGSNSPRQLAERLGHAVKGRAAFVEGHLRAFRGWSNRWEGGVATLIPGRGKTFGYIAEVTPDDLAILDRYEGVATGNYRRANMQVTTNDGEKVQAIAYLASSTEKNAPSRAYKRAVAETIGAFWEGENGPVTEADITVRNPAKWFGHLVTDDQKVTISKEPIAEVQNTEALQKAAPKPRGLWYACGSEWIEWLESEMPHWLEEGQNLYDVRPRYSTVGVAEGYRGKRYVGGVLRITTDKEMEMFDLGFYVTDMQIDWPRVASIWDGIEICPYQYSFRDIYGWYYGWDVASGCIWRPSGADGLTLLHSRVARQTPAPRRRGFSTRNPRRMDGSVRPTRATQVNAYLAENGFPGVMLHRSARDAYCHFYGGDTDYWDDTSVYVPRISDLTLDAWLAEARRLAQTKRNPRRRNPARPARPKKFSNDPLTAQEKKDSGIANVYLMDWVCDGWGPLPPRIAEFEARRTPLTNAEKRELIDWYENNCHVNMF